MAINIFKSSSSILLLPEDFFSEDFISTYIRLKILIPKIALFGKKIYIINIILVFHFYKGIAAKAAADRRIVEDR
jgi:hypothetical protein